jgi:hypothetical protein
MTRPSHPPRLDYSNYTWRRVQITKLLVMQFSPFTRHLIPPWSKYPPQHPVLKHPQSHIYKMEINTGLYGCEENGSVLPFLFTQFFYFSGWACSLYLTFCKCVRNTDNCCYTFDYTVSGWACSLYLTFCKCVTNTDNCCYTIPGWACSLYLTLNLVTMSNDNCMSCRLTYTFIKSGTCHNAKI